MVTAGLYVPLKAKPGKEAEVEAFLEGELALVNDERHHRVIRDPSL